MPYFTKESFPKHLKCYTRCCAWCETTFYSSKPKAKYCQSTCRAYAYQKRHPERVEKQPTKKELQAAFERYQKQSIRFDSIKELEQVKKQLQLLKSHLQLINTAWVEVQEDELIHVLLQELKFNKETIEQINLYLKK